MSYGSGDLRTVYRTGPFGVEQTFVVARPVAGGGRRLVVLMRAGGSLRPVLSGSQLLFGDAGSGAVALRYGDLRVVDAAGRVLPSHIELSGHTVGVVVDVVGARFPVRVDPFIQQGESLTGAGEIGKGSFGGSVAISGDGNTVLIGGANDDGDAGAARNISVARLRCPVTATSRSSPAGDPRKRAKKPYGCSPARGTPGRKQRSSSTAKTNHGAETRRTTRSSVERLRSRRTGPP